MSESPMVEVAFYVRTPVDGGLFNYDRLEISGRDGDGRLHTNHPPLAGDTIHLWDSITKRGGMFRIIERSWLHSSYGSTNWPYGDPRSRVGPSLDCIVEAADGLFVNEAPDQGAQSDE